MSFPKLALIAAVARNGVIGQGGVLPWHLPEDLAYFRRVTQGHPVVMGRRTWESLPARFRPLPGRRNIVLTRQPGWASDGAETAANWPAAQALLAGQERAFVIGGAEVFRELMPAADELWLTEVQADVVGDTLFPPWPRAEFEEVSRDTVHAAPPADVGLAFVRYVRRTSSPSM